MKKNLFDPNTVHRDLVKRMEGKLGVKLEDPTNTFTLMLEAISESNTASLQASATMMRDVYPTIANDFKGLMRHASNEELIGLFANPSMTTMTVFLNAVDILSHGVNSSTGNGQSRKVVMKEGTRISVDSLIFCTTTDITIHYDGEHSIVEQDTTDVNRVGSIPSYIVPTNDGGKWVRFDVLVRQYDYYTRSYDVVGSFRKILPYKDDIRYVEATGIFNGVRKEIPLTYSDINYNADEATLRIQHNYNEQHGKHVLVELPNVYNLTDPVSSIEITIRSTRGEINKRLTDFTDLDFKVIKVETEFNFINVTMQVFNNGVITGGKDIKSMEEVKENIINSTTGPLKVPITKAQLEEKAKRDGFDITLYKDMVTNRLFTVSKNVDIETFPEDHVIPNIFINEANILAGTDENGIHTEHDALVIDSNTLFTSVNGLTTPVKDVGLLDTWNMLGGYDSDELLNYLTK